MTTSRAKWILASASPRRREILGGLGLKFAVQPANGPEPAYGGDESPAGFAARVARMKAYDIGRLHRSGFVIGADTIVVAGDRVLGKPESRANAHQMLRALSGRWHEVITGLCVLDCRTGHERSKAAISRVHFRRLKGAEIEWYLNTGEYKDKAGAYAIQGRASLFIDRIEGCYFNVVGFPVATFETLCRQMGIPLIRTMRRS